MVMDRRTAGIEGESRYDDLQLAAAFADGAVGRAYNRSRPEIRAAFDAGRNWVQALEIRASKEAAS